MSFFNFRTNITGVAGGKRSQLSGINKNMVLAQFGAQQGFTLDRFAPMSSPLATDNLVQSWLPKEPARLNKFLRDIYTFDAIAGPAIDLMTSLPFSDAICTGINDKGILAIYQECIDALELQNLMINISREFLIIGRAVGSARFDQTRGIWSDLFINDPDSCRIDPIPIRGATPKVDLIIPNDLKRFLASKDYRDIEVRKTVPEKTLKEMSRGLVKLDPLSTVYLARQTSSKDVLGTSIFYRIIPFVMLENALISGTIVAAHRRQRSIMHLSIGDSENWIPTPDEINAIAGMFMSADEDPQGAIVATRDGISTNEVRSGGDFWKVSEEWDFLSRAKMTALGVSESFLSGEATFATMEAALSVFIEHERAFRDSLASRIFTKQLFPTLARVHKFVSRTQAEINHRIYPNRSNTPEEKLLIPKLEWLKQLRPEADRDYIDILGTLEEKGLPIPLATWAAVGGQTLDRILSMQSDDILNRKKVKLWLDAIKKSKGEASEASASTKIRTSMLNNLPIWDRDGKFLGIPKRDFRSFPELESMDEDKADAFNYIYSRLGLGNAKFSKKAISRIAAHIADNSHKYAPSKVFKELTAFNTIVQGSNPTHNKNVVALPIKRQLDIYSGVEN